MFFSFIFTFFCLKEAGCSSKMKPAIDSSPDLFGQFSPENRKFQPKSTTFQHSNPASKVLFSESSRNETEDLSENQEIISSEKSIRSCPLCQENFPEQYVETLFNSMSFKDKVLITPLSSILLSSLFFCILSIF